MYAYVKTNMFQFTPLLGHMGLAMLLKGNIVGMTYAIDISQRHGLLGRFKDIYVLGTLRVLIGLTYMLFVNENLLLISYN